MSELNLLRTETENDLRATVRQFLARNCEPSAVTAMYDGDRSVVGGLWTALSCDLGLGGLLVSEGHGGAGAGPREAAVVLEELGRAVAPVPFLTSSVLAVALLNQTDDAAILPGLASGDQTAALVVPLSTRPGGHIPAVTVDGSELISGTITSVAGVLEADVLLVPVSAPAGLAIHVVRASDARIEPITSLDMTRQIADVTFDRCAGTLLLADAEPAVRHALIVAAGLLASEQVGIAKWCLRSTVHYLGQRRQFGRPVGGFQAIKHRMADLYSGVVAASAAASHAAASLAAHDRDGEIAAAVAHAYCSDVAVLAAEEAVQLHAGIGMTWEHPAHLYLKRAKADQLSFGTPEASATVLASLVGLPACRGLERGLPSPASG
jgi:alkylation response protein AidB-like acyl-CoA dehydrogenase